MPRWKALPDGLDPQVREFASQLRRLVDRSGLSIAAVADRTGYSKTSWERYLNGRLLAPKGAIVALAEVTGTNQNHLTTMWELAERAWSRSEMRHDMTMEAIRISQARAALGEFGSGGPAPAAGGRNSRAGGGKHSAGAGVSTAAGSGPGTGGPAAGVRDEGRASAVPVQRGASVEHTPPEETSAEGAAARSRQQSPRDQGWPDVLGASGYGPGGPSGPPAAAPLRQPQGQPGRRRRTTMFLVGAASALVVIAGAVLLTDLDGDDGKKTAAPSPEPSTSAPKLPAGVECSGADCTGQDPEAMGCGGEYAGTVSRATVGAAVIEVRYSETCAAAWARITEAAPGDTVRIGAGADQQDGKVNVDTHAYTPMVAVKKVSDAKACATLVSGTKGCTTPQ